MALALLPSLHLSIAGSTVIPGYLTSFWEAVNACFKFELSVLCTVYAEFFLSGKIRKSLGRYRTLFVDGSFGGII